MKHNYFSLLALAGAMFMSTSAWAIDPPTEVEPAYTTDWAAPENGGVYFLYNVGADQFLGGGNNWGTHVVTATVDSEEEYMNAEVYYWDAGIAFSGAQTQMNVCCGVLPIKLTQNEDGTFYIEHMGSDRTACYLTSEDGNSWIDGDQGRAATFNIVAVDGGYTIQPTNTVEAETYFGAQDPETEPTDGEMVVRNVMTNLTAETGHIVWRFAPTNYNAWKAYEFRMPLYEKIEEAQAEGIDTSDAEVVYNNPDATAEDVQEAINALKLAINQKTFADLFEGASEEDPLDVTEWAIENPTFESDINGWTITVGGQNCQWQARTDGQVDEAQNWVRITNFIEAWRPAPNALGDGAIFQTIYGLPQGKYVLECDAMATLQGGSPSPEEAVENAFLFIENDNSEVRTPIKAPDTQPKHWTVTFIVPEGNKAITLGLKVENTTANWLSADNFQLWYYGRFEGTPEQAELQQAIKNTASSVEKIESGIYQAYQGAIDAFEKALEDAQSIAASVVSAEEYLAAKATLEAAQAEYEASVKAYEKLGTFIGADGSASKLDEYMETAAQLGDLYDILEPWQQELTDGYYDGTITTERVEEIMGGFLTKIREYIKMGSIEPGADITILLDNPDFSEGNGKSLTGTAVPGWTITGGPLTEERAKTGNIETWHAKFDFSQTITDMPAGIYDITVQGFVRHDDGNDTEGAYFKAGDTKTNLMTLEDQWSFEPLYGTDQADMGDTNRDATMTTPEGETAYKCNGMTGAYYWFQTEIPADLYETFKYKAPEGQDWTGDKYYTNHIKVVLKQSGDFTISLGTTSGTDWMIWDNFKIKYIGEDLDVYSEMVLEEFAKLQEAYDVDPDDKFVTKEGEDLYAAVAQKVDDVKNIENGDDALALIEEIGQVLAYINAGNKAGATLRSTYYLYAETMMGLVESSDETFPALLSQIEDQLADPSQIANNDAIQTIIASLKKGWTKYVMADVINVASAENPQDVTAAIYNPDYKNYDLSVDEPTNATGWTNEGSNGSTVFNGTYYEEIEFYNTNFNHYQTIEGLQPGWYIISNDAFYRAGAVEAMTTAYNDSVPAINSYMYAVVAGDTVTTAKLHSMFDGAQVEATGSDGEVTVNLNGEEGVETLYVPNLMGSALAFLTLEDYETGEKFYTNTIAAEVKEDGVLTIGVRKNDLITNDWTVITNWALYYTGQELPAGMSTLEAKQSVKVVQLFGIDGRQQTRLQRGINIVRMADGSVQKVLVK